jgi:hypothetical protein
MLRQFDAFCKINKPSQQGATWHDHRTCKTKLNKPVEDWNLPFYASDLNSVVLSSGNK